jgi:hypothetical protein
MHFWKSLVPFLDMFFSLFVLSHSTRVIGMLLMEGHGVMVNDITNMYNRIAAILFLNVFNKV